MSYKIVACDLDETLLDKDHKICDYNKEMILKMKDKGAKFVFATGRGYNTVYDDLKTLGLYEEGQYTISFNGAAITENKTDKLFHFQGITYQQADMLYKNGLKYDVCMHVYTLDKVYVYNYIDEERAHIEGRMPIVEFFDEDLSALKDDTFVKVLYMSTDVPFLESIEKEMGSMTEDFDVSYSSNRYLEFNHKNVNKGEGLKMLCEILECSIEEAIAVGDNINDLPMIKVAGLGCGVANVVDSMKADCDYICEKDNNEGGVGEVIQKFVL